MAIVHEPGQDGRGRSSRSLGDLLYADKTRPLVSEGDWVGIVRSIAAGDQCALHALYERTYRIVFTLIMRITRDPESAEELTLDVFHGVWQRAATYEPESGTVIGWIMNQARSRAIDRLRFEQRKKRVDAHASDPLSAADPTTPPDALYRSDLGRVLRSALLALTPDERQAIGTAYFSDLSYAEAAARLKQPLGTVKTRIRSGLRKLREVLAEGTAS